MSLSSKQSAFLFKVACLVMWVNKQSNLRVTGGELYRTVEQQAIYYADGRSKKKYSKHQDRLAIDLNLFIDGRLATPEEYRAIGEYWESLGGIWGGRYGVKKEDYHAKVGWDSNHFEWRR